MPSRASWPSSASASSNPSGARSSPTLPRPRTQPMSSVSWRSSRRRRTSNMPKETFKQKQTRLKAEREDEVEEARRKKLKYDALAAEEAARHPNVVTLTPQVGGKMEEDFHALQEEVGAQKVVITGLQDLLKTLQPSKPWAIPSRKDLTAWCEKHPKDADAVSIVKHDHSWWGPVQTALAVLANIRPEGGTGWTRTPHAHS